jgi:hypothetical protein
MATAQAEWNDHARNKGIIQELIKARFRKVPRDTVAQMRVNGIGSLGKWCESLETTRDLYEYQNL